MVPYHIEEFHLFVGYLFVIFECFVVDSVRISVELRNARNTRKLLVVANPVVAPDGRVKVDVRSSPEVFIDLRRSDTTTELRPQGLGGSAFSSAFRTLPLLM
jgi:hypothetical protein